MAAELCRNCSAGGSLESVQFFFVGVSAVVAKEDRHKLPRKAAVAWRASVKAEWPFIYLSMLAVHVCVLHYLQPFSIRLRTSLSADTNTAETSQYPYAHLVLPRIHASTPLHTTSPPQSPALLLSHSQRVHTRAQGNGMIVVGGFVIRRSRLQEDVTN